MAKTNITQYSATPSSNADINDINIAENCPASGLNNAIRELMAHLKNVDTGSQALTALSVTGALSCGAFTSNGIDDNADATAVTIDSDENVCIGVTSKNSANNGSLTIGHTGMTKISASASGNADELVLIGADASANVGMSIISNNANQGSIFFGDEDDTDIGGITYDHSDNSMRFTTNTSERMRINNSTLQINQNSQSRARVDIISNLGAYSPVLLQNDTDNTGGIFIAFVNHSGTTIGSISQNSTATQFNTSSDYRLKENVNYTFDATTELKKLKPAKFNFIGDSNTVEGFLAHEVSDVVPIAISGVKDGTKDIGTIKDADGNILRTNAPEVQKEDGQTWTKTGTENVYQGIDQSKLVPLLVKTIQELEARITALENK